MDAAGTSPLLGKPTMEATYWALAPLARTLSRNGVSANGVTGSSLVLGIFAGISLGTGHFGLGGAFAAASALCDALDGFVARETRSQSQAGEIFDAAADRYNEFFFLAGVAFFYRSSVPIPRALVLRIARLVHGQLRERKGREPSPVATPRLDEETRTNDVSHRGSDSISGFCERFRTARSGGRLGPDPPRARTRRHRSERVRRASPGTNGTACHRPATRGPCR